MHSESDPIHPSYLSPNFSSLLPSLKSKETPHLGELLHVLLLIHAQGGAGADEVTVSVDVVDASAGGPELVGADPRGGEGGGVLGVVEVPRVCDYLVDGVGGVVEGRVLELDLAGSDVLDLGADGEHGVAEPV